MTKSQDLELESSGQESSSPHYSTESFSLSSVSLPSKPDEAQKRVGDACKLRMEYIDMKAKYLHRLQELLNDVKRIDAKISEVDIHIGGLYHVVEKSMAGMPAIFARRERTIIVEGDVHSVQLESEWDGEENKYLSVTLD